MKKAIGILSSVALVTALTIPAASAAQCTTQATPGGNNPGQTVSQTAGGKAQPGNQQASNAQRGDKQPTNTQPGNQQPGKTQTPPSNTNGGNRTFPLIPCITSDCNIYISCVQTDTANTGSGSSSQTESTTDLSAYETEVVALVNEARAQYGLSALTASKDLSDLARTKSQDMSSNNYFSHTSPTYGTAFDMLKAAGITYKYAGENIAYGYATPAAVVTGWMNSEGHRANILSASYTQIGVGYVADGNYWTQIFTG
ncbi:MAG: CAP domain-containing protein [Oscillospiraceae bacterium]|nr:CAP domain-containing protein [Oscillospiraceae bacterium]